MPLAFGWSPSEGLIERHRIPLQPPKLDDNQIRKCGK